VENVLIIYLKVTKHIPQVSFTSTHSNEKLCIVIYLPPQRPSCLPPHQRVAGLNLRQGVFSFKFFLFRTSHPQQACHR
jgi:hypothetical protein